MSRRWSVAQRWGGPGTTFVLGLLCLALAVGASAGVWWDRQPGSTRPTSQTPVTSLDSRDAALEAAAPLTEQVLSYGVEDFDGRVARTRALLTAGFAASYDAQMAELRDAVVADGITVRATASRAGVVSASPDQAVALVFLDQVSSARDAAGQRRDQVRVLVTLRAEEREWRVARLDSF